AGGEELHADEGDQHTQDGARTAVRVNVAEHGDQDREQDIRRAKVDIGGVCPAQDDDARDGGQHPGDDVADQQDAPVVDTGEPGGGRVAADQVKLHAKPGAAQHQRQDRRDDQQDDQREGDAEHDTVANELRLAD